MDSLKGNFLLATPQMPDPRFQEQIIYICSHDDEGAMGLVINQPSAYTLTEIFRSANIEAQEKEWPAIYVGGPVDVEAAFFLYSSEYISKHGVLVSDGVSLSRDPQIIHDIAIGEGPQEFLFVLGYVGWGAGQLESELTVNGWLTLPADNKIIFRVSDSLKWKEAARNYGIDMSLFSDELGSA